MDTAPQSESTDSSALGHEAWRDIVVNRMSVVLLLLTALGMPFVALQLDNLAIALTASSMWVVLFSAWYFRARTPLWVRTLALMQVGFGAIISGFLTAGALVLPSLAGLMAVILAGLVFGQRAALYTHLSLVSILLFLGLAIHLGWVQGPPPDGASMAVPLAWVREAIGFGSLGAVLYVTVAYVVQRIESSLGLAEDALARLRDEQAERAAAQAALRDSDRRMQEMQRVEALGRLAGGVAHDFNNSLTVLMSGLDLLESELDAREREVVLRDMRDAASGSAQLTRQLLAYGRKDVIRPEVIRISDILERSARSLRRLLPDDIRLEVYPGLAQTVLVDRAQLDHVLLNLVLNARDAIRGRGTITVSCGDDARSGHVMLTVRDTGCGMAPEVLSRVFEPFFTTKSEGEGSGLGLSMVSGMVERWRGTINIESRLGEGTAIHVSLPRADEVEVEERREVQTPVVGTATILVAEDEAPVRRTIVRALSSRGFTVLQAADGDEALAVLREYEDDIDLLCTDGVMPGAPCAEVVDAYQSRFPGGPVLVCSGYVREELIRRQVRDGAVEFVPKPFTRAQLLEHVDSVMSARSTGEPGPSRNPASAAEPHG